VKALDDDNPAAGGTRDSINIFIPHGLENFFLRGELRASIAL